MNECADDAGARVPTLRAVVVKATVTHTITYFAFGLLALFVFDYARLYAETELVHLMRPTTDPMVMAGPLFQPIRGVLFGVLLYACYAFFGRRWGWLRLWMVLVGIGILGTPGPTAGSLEGMIYTEDSALGAAQGVAGGPAADLGVLLAALPLGSTTPRRALAELVPGGGLRGRRILGQLWACWRGGGDGFAVARHCGRDTRPLSEKVPHRAEVVGCFAGVDGLTCAAQHSPSRGLVLLHDAK